VAVTSANRIDAAAISLGLSTAFAATAGARDIVVTNLSDGGSTVCSGCLVVTAGPTVAEVSPSVLCGGATVTGANFDGGGPCGQRGQR
jgi:hypothetical protein